MVFHFCDSRSDLEVKLLSSRTDPEIARDIVHELESQLGEGRRREGVETGLWSEGRGESFVSVAIVVALKVRTKIANRCSLSVGERWSHFSGSFPRA